MPRLTVLTVRVSDSHSIAAAVRRLSDLMFRAESGDMALLLLWLPPAHSLRMPQDELLLSGLSDSMRSPGASGRFLFLVPRRVWSDAQRCYLPDEAGLLPLLSAVIHEGRFPSAPQAASFAPDALNGAFDAVCILPPDCLCTPDMPSRLFGALDEADCVCGILRPHRSFPDTALERLQADGFSLMPLSGGLSAPPLCFSRSALRDAAAGLPVIPTPVPGCLFVRTVPPAPATLLSDVRRDVIRLLSGRVSLFETALSASFAEESAVLFPPDAASAPPDALLRLDAALPLLRAVFFAIGAASGSEPLFLLALLLPELPVLRHPARWPHALVRLALLPAHAAAVLSGWLAVRFAKSPGLRVSLPLRFASARLCQLAGCALLALAVRGMHALAPALFVSLLWLGAPFVFFALVSPSRERIALRPKELRTLRVRTEAAFSPDCFPAAPPAVRMLCVCAACLLGYTDAPEAAEQLLNIFTSAPSSPASPLESACALCTAAFLRENGAAHDAVLRRLSHALDSWAMADLQEDQTLLSLLLVCARRREAQPGHLALMRGASVRTAADALFLPLSLSIGLPDDSPAHVLDKPHTALRSAGTSSAADALRFLCLASASLGRPFERLLQASPVVSPVWPALSLIE